MGTVSVFELSGLPHPALSCIATRVGNVFRLAAEKAAAHWSDPRSYPLGSDGRALERAFLGRLRGFGSPKREAAAARAFSFATSSALVRRVVYGDLVEVDLHCTTPVASQARALPWPVDLALPASHGREGLLPDHRPAAPEMLRLARELLHSEPSWTGEGGREIRIHRGLPAPGARFGDAGRRGRLPVLTLFERTGDPEWSFLTLLGAREPDAAGAFLNVLAAHAKREVAAALLHAAGGEAARVAGLAALGGAVAGFSLGRVLAWLRTWWAEGLEETVTLAIRETSPSLRAAGASDGSRAAEWALRRGSGSGSQAPSP
jgi:hypothetical protein